MITSQLSPNTDFFSDSRRSSNAQDVDIENIVSLLRNQGYAVVPNFASEATVNNILAETAVYKARVNANEPGPVIHGVTQFFTNIISGSQTVCDIMLSPLVMDLCSSYFTDRFELINNRIQTTRANVAMPWHTDNNLLEGGTLIGRHDMPGLNFILYLTNVDRAPFQLIPDSNHWSLEHPGQYLSDDEIQRAHYQVVELSPKPGDLLILNTHIFHRASPIIDRKYSRSILLFQVDQVSKDYPNHGEALYVNPGLIRDISPAVMSFLGFSRKRAYPAFPESSIASLGTDKLYDLQLELLKVLPRAVALKILKRILPSNIVTRIKNSIVGKRSSRTSQPQARAMTSANPYLDS